MIPKSPVILLFCSGFSSFWLWVGGEAGDTKTFFFSFKLLETFPITSWRFALKYNLYAFCILRACFLSISRVTVFTSQLRLLTHWRKIFLHFEVPFGCHSRDLWILSNCYIQAPHKSVMLDARWQQKLKTLRKLVGLHWGREGNEICVLVCFI